MGVSAVMLILFYVSALKAGRPAVEELAGSQHWLVFPFVQAFTFAAGMSILMTGVRMFLGKSQLLLFRFLRSLFPILVPLLMYRLYFHLHQQQLLSDSCLHMPLD